MVLNILRALFVLLAGAVGWFYVTRPEQPFGDFTWLAMAVCVCVAVFFVCIDILSPRRKLMIFSGTFLGLIVGILTAYALSYVVQMMVDQFIQLDPTATNYFALKIRHDTIVQAVTLLVGVVCCYLSISFIMQTKDDFRFIIPYVEFTKQTKGARPILLDTNILIDGRISDIVASGILEGQLVVPQFVLNELQAVADSGDKLKRNRGRRGLDVLANLRNSRKVDVIFYDGSGHLTERKLPVDQQLMELAKELNGRVLTNDFNLNKVAQLSNVDVININDLATALRPVVLPGETLRVRIVKPGEGAGQGVGYLEDGTMVVVENARASLNQEVQFVVTNALQNSAGKMVFGRMVDSESNPQQRRPKAQQAEAT
jgi:uncharacterized protein YacL